MCLTAEDLSYLILAVAALGATEAILLAFFASAQKKFYIIFGEIALALFFLLDPELVEYLRYIPFKWMFWVSIIALATSIIIAKKGNLISRDEYNVVAFGSMKYHAQEEAQKILDITKRDPSLNYPCIRVAPQAVIDEFLDNYWKEAERILKEHGLRFSEKVWTGTHPRQIKVRILKYKIEKEAPAQP